MKQYLWAAIVLVFVGANASDNPFDLDANLKKIDQDQDVLLSELRVLSEAKVAREDAEMEEEESNLEEETVATDTNVPNNISEKDTIEADNAVVVQPGVTEEDKIKKIAEDQVEIEAQRTENEIEIQKEYAEIRRVKLEKEKAEQERLAAEKLEVEKYEAQRVAKKKREAEELDQLEAEKAKLENKKAELETQKAPLENKNIIADINITRENTEAEKEADKVYTEAVTHVDKEDTSVQLKAETEVAAKSAIAEVNITREEAEAKKEADKAYEEALLEVNRED